MALIPYVRERKDAYSQEVSDIYSRLLEDRIVFIDQDINDALASLVVAELLYLESKDKKEDISIYINSGGGSVTAGLAIIDAMELIAPDVSTVCVGKAASMAAVILSAGTKGKRFATKRSEIMIHQPIGGAIGQASDVKIRAEHILKKRKMINEMLAEYTGKDINRLDADTERDNYLESEEAIAYGMIDGVITNEQRKG